jgi:hypothetical protein
MIKKYSDTLKVMYCQHVKSEVLHAFFRTPSKFAGEETVGMVRSETLLVGQ